LAEPWQKADADDGSVAENLFPSAKIFGQQANLIFRCIVQRACQPPQIRKTGRFRVAPPYFHAAF
jgi:hypothetical protein